MAVAKSHPLALICGDDEFAIKQRAKQIFTEWTAEVGGLDQEIIPAGVGSSGEALAVLGRLREALQTLPFFGGGKVVWLRDCSFLGEERAASSQAVTTALAELAEEWKVFAWQNVRLLISAGKADKRRVFYKTLEKIATVETFSAWSQEDKDWAGRAEKAAQDAVHQREKEISADALGELINRAGFNARQLENEIEKLCVFIGNRKRIERQDVAEVCSRNKSAKCSGFCSGWRSRRLCSRLARRLPSGTSSESWLIPR